VLAKYGLTEKAMERLGELLVLNPQHSGGLSLLIRLHLDEDRYTGAAELATELLRAAPRSEAWTESWERLERSGFVATEDGMVLPPGAEEEDADTAPGLEMTAAGEAGEPAFEVTATTEPAFDLAPELGGEEPALGVDAADEPGFDPAPELGDGEPGAPSPGPGTPAAADAAAEIDAALSGLGPAEPSAGRSAAPAAAAPSRAPGKATPARRSRSDVEGLLASLAADLLPHRRRRAAAPPPAGREPASAPTPGRAAALPPEAAPPPPAAPAETAPPAPPPADASPEWLEHTVSGETPPPAEEGMFSDEEDFFDLAAELEEELSREGTLGEGDDLLLEQPREQSIEEIVEGFKKGVAENLSAEDHSTHFDLGIAYREMGLLDEAIGEFQVAAKSPELLVECCSMLGLCFLEKGLPELAVKWYRRGLDTPGLGEDEQLGLLYELGNAHMAAGERTEAHRTFLDLYGTNSNYRDVVAKVEETRAR
jgi:tetratricopeptide (TPR) repeat protein